MRTSTSYKFWTGAPTIDKIGPPNGRRPIRPANSGRVEARSSGSTRWLEAAGRHQSESARHVSFRGRPPSPISIRDARRPAGRPPGRGLSLDESPAPRRRQGWPSPMPSRAPHPKRSVGFVELNQQKQPAARSRSSIAKQTAAARVIASVAVESAAQVREKNSYGSCPNALHFSSM